MTDVNSLKVLMVDDMSTIRTILKKDLEVIGIKDHDFAEDGAQALQKILSAADEKPFDLILCDWNMPMLTGIELLRMIRKNSNPKVNQVRFVMITGNELKVKEAMESGSDNFIAKPFQANDLLKKIEFVFR